MKQLTDFVLLQATLTDAAGLAPLAQQWCAKAALPMTLHRAAWAASTAGVYVYGRLNQPTALDAPDVAALADAWQLVCPAATGVRASRLALALDVQGVSHTQVPAFHYVVETDPELGWADEIFRWYDSEHMPGLAAVPGCIHARRLLNHDHGPLSLACYDLVSEDTLGSASWLAVRGTAWSDITRPHFTNTLRSMMTVLA
jgi:hypothetical protein